MRTIRKLFHINRKAYTLSKQPKQLGAMICQKIQSIHMNTNPEINTTTSEPSNSGANSLLIPYKKVPSIWQLVALLLIVGIAASAYVVFLPMYEENQQIKKENNQVKKELSEAKENLNNPDKAAQVETELLVEKINKHTELPPADIENGEPTLATVQDITKLQGQEFFANAQNGDKVLIFSNAKKSYLYRPSTDKIINSTPVTTDY